MRKKILLADDHAIVRDGLKHLINGEDDLLVTGEVGSSEGTLRCLHQENFDLVMLDVALPDRSGVETLQLIRKSIGAIPVLVLSGYPEEQFAINLMRAGANGYLRKDAEPEKILKAVRICAENRKFISDKVADLLTHSDSASHKPLHTELSKREFQVMCRLAQGQSATRIAEELFVSIKSVSTYRARLLDKLKLKSNSDLTYYAIKQGLIE